MSQDFTLFKQRLEESGMNKDQVESILEIAHNSIYPKKYGLVWEERVENVKEDLKLKIPYLEDIKAREIKLNEPNSPHHFLIEGDNYEALKLLQATHRGKVNVIYIDPPYNTGNKDFKYNDRYLDKDDAWKHSYWLSFMHKRLLLAKELMSEDGLLFISIDDNEMAQLKLLCDEVFGEDNFVNNISVTMSTLSGPKMAHTDKRFPKIKETVLFYKKRALTKINPAKVVKTHWDTEYNKFLLNFDYDLYQVFKEGYFEGDIDFINQKLSKVDEISLQKAFELFDIKKDNEYDFLIKNAYRIVRTSSASSLKNKVDKIKSNSNQNFVAVEMQRGALALCTTTYNTKSKSPRVQCSFAVDTLETSLGDLWTDISTAALHAEGGVEFKNGKKPLKLIKRLLSTHLNKNAIILDFFAGSGTTGHAVLELNKEDGGNRQFILCTNNENNICEEVTYERLKRVMNGYTTPKGKEVEGLPANLKYLKVEMLEKETYTDEDLSYLYIPHILPLLQLKHNAFTLVSETNHGWVFEGEGFRFGLADPLATKQDFDQLKEHLEHYEGEKILYLFSTDTQTYPKYKQLASLENCIQPIPREFLELISKG